MIWLHTLVICSSHPQQPFALAENKINIMSLITRTYKCNGNKILPYITLTQKCLALVQNNKHRFTGSLYLLTENSTVFNLTLNFKQQTTVQLFKLEHCHKMELMSLHRWNGSQIEIQGFKYIGDNFDNSALQTCKILY